MTETKPRFNINDWAPADPARWREAASKATGGDLHGALTRLTADAIAYSAFEAEPRPFLRSADRAGGDRRIYSVIREESPSAVNAGIHAALQHDVTGVAIDPGPDADADWFEFALRNVSLNSTVVAVFGSEPLCRLLETAQARRYNPSDLTVSVFVGPGDDRGAMGLICDAAPRATLCADAGFAHLRGAGPATELGATLAVIADRLRQVVTNGLSVADAVQRFRALVRVDAHVPTNIAKIRAARRLTRRLAELCGSEASPQVSALTSTFMMSGVDRDTNIIRNTLAAFAALAGGADALCMESHDVDDPDAHRLARNTAWILLKESRLDHPGDPAAGSPFFDDLTERFCAQAWAFFQEVERIGGVTHAASLIEERIAADWEARAAQLQAGAKLVGVTDFTAPQPGTAYSAGADSLARASGTQANAA